jgi:hypothetical protein
MINLLLGIVSLGLLMSNCTVTGEPKDGQLPHPIAVSGGTDTACCEGGGDAATSPPSYIRPDPQCDMQEDICNLVYGPGEWRRK